MRCGKGRGRERETIAAFYPAPWSFLANTPEGKLAIFFLARPSARQNALKLRKDKEGKLPATSDRNLSGSRLFAA